MDMENFARLSKKERRKLVKELKAKELQKKLRLGSSKKILVWATIFILIGLGFYWLTKVVTAPSPGQSIKDLGREHVAAGSKIEYNSNPPTSGSHYEQWEKTGIYGDVLVDEKLVHSLEHGYVIISYNCDYPEAKTFNSFNIDVYAHIEDETQATESGQVGTSSAHLEFVKWKDDLRCKELVSQLESLANSQKLWKLIVVPRPNLDSRIALTAWTRIDKFNKFDEQRITAFIKAFRDKGPEKTME